MRATDLVKATIKKESAQEAAEADLFSEQKRADGLLYKQQQDAEAKLFTNTKSAEGKLYSQRQDAEASCKSTPSRSFALCLRLRPSQNLRPNLQSLSEYRVRNP